MHAHNHLIPGDEEFKEEVHGKLPLLGTNRLPFNSLSYECQNIVATFLLNYFARKMTSFFLEESWAPEDRYSLATIKRSMWYVMVIHACIQGPDGETA